MTQKRRVRVSERDTLERSSRDGCCLGEGSALTLLSMSGPDRLRSAPTTQSQPILLLSDRFSCARGACDERKEKTKRACNGTRSPPPDVHANARTIARTLSNADETGRAAAVGGLCSWRPCNVAGCGEAREDVAGGGSHRSAPVVVYAVCRSPLHMRQHDGGSAPGLPQADGNRWHHLVESHVPRLRQNDACLLGRPDHAPLTTPYCAPVAVHSAIATTQTATMAVASITSGFIVPRQNPCSERMARLDFCTSLLLVFLLFGTSCLDLCLFCRSASRKYRHRKKSKAVRMERKTVATTQDVHSESENTLCSIKKKNRLPAQSKQPLFQYSKQEQTTQNETGHTVR